MLPTNETGKMKKGALAQLLSTGVIAGISLALCWLVGAISSHGTGFHHRVKPTHNNATLLGSVDLDQRDSASDQGCSQQQLGEALTQESLLQIFCQYHTASHKNGPSWSDCIQIARQQLEYAQSAAPALESTDHNSKSSLSDLQGIAGSNLKKTGVGSEHELGMIRPGRFSELQGELQRILLENTILESARFTDRSVTQFFGRIHPLSLGLTAEQRARRPLDVVYQKQPFHWQWHIDQHMQKVQRPIRMILDPNSQRYQNNAIIAVNHLTFKHSDRYFTEQAKRGNTNIAALHSGDITMSQSYGWYKKTKFVLRNHYPSRSVAVKKGMALDRMYVLPLGSLTHDSMSFVNRGEFGRIQLASKRKHLCNFVGSLTHHGTRMALGKALHAAGMGPDPSKAKYEKWGTAGGVKCFTYYSGDWKNKKQMPPWEYRAVISNSAFTFVPRGTGPSSFRLTEALELGSIPIISDIDNFNLPYGEHPLPTIKDSQWGTLPPVLVKMYSEHPEELDALQEKAFTWWHAWKQTYQWNMACLVERDVMASPGARQDCLSPGQFAGYQLTAKDKLKFKK